MKEVKCNFKNISDEDKASFKESTCLLLVSVGQEAHEGDRLLATIKLVNENFQSCIISLYDSLQRFTMSLSRSCDPEDLRKSAEREGNLWLERNKNILNNFAIPITIYRWEHWVNDLYFPKRRQELLARIASDPDYKKAHENAIEGYLERYCRHLDDQKSFDRNRAVGLCQEYVLEECAVLCLWPKLRCQFEIYPNIHNAAIEATRERFILPNFPNNLSPLTLRFRNAKQLKPQKFESVGST